MSGIYGLWQRDGRPTTPDQVAAMAGSMRHRGSDGNFTWESRSVALGCQLNRITPESFLEKPVERDEGGNRVVFDGRIDDRNELFALAEVRGEPSDSQLLLALYRRFGPAFAGRLKGEYAIALFDEVDQCLLLARDGVGTKPLYYFLDDRLLIFASEIKALLTHQDVPAKPNLQYVAVQMLGGMPPADQGTTHFQDIISLRPGHTLVVRPTAVQSVEHWDFNVEEPIRFRRGEEYVEAFRHHFTTAVRRRTRSAYPVAISVSGGIDSSSIFCTAKSIEQPGLTPQIFGVNHRGADGSSADEEKYIVAIEAMYHTSIERLPIEFCGMLGGIERTIRTFEAPWSDSHWRNNERMLEAAAAKGARILLGGQWGDQVFFDHTYLVDLLRALRFPALRAHLTELPQWMGGHRNWLAKQTMRQAVKSFLPEFARPLVQAYRRKNAPMHRDQPWYTEKFRAQARRAWPVYTPPAKRFISRSAQSRYQDAHAKYYTQAMEMFNKAGAAAGVQYEFPALDQDLLEFLMRIPGEQIARGGVHRGILREAMRDILPESIRQRRSKGNFTSIENEMVAAQYADLVRFFAKPSKIERDGILDKAQLDAALESIPGRLRRDGCRMAWDLSDLVALEVWMGTYFGNMPTKNKVAPREQPVYFG